MELGMSQRLKEEQKLTLDLKLGYEANFKIENLVGEPYLLLEGFSIKSQGNLKTFHSIGGLSKTKPSISEIQSLIWDYYNNRKLQDIALSYRVFDLNNNQVDEGYIQDKFGKGLLNPDEYKKIENWQGLPMEGPPKKKKSNSRKRTFFPHTYS